MQFHSSLGFLQVGFSAFPHWLEALLTEKFFTACLMHEAARKNEKNILCLDCCVSICPHCLPLHRSHRLIQIRRYVYHDVIRVEDGEKLIDCNFVQSYTTNSSKVIFLNQRPQSRPFRSSGNICITCERSLQDPYLFCSLACKHLPQYLALTDLPPLPLLLQLQHLMTKGGGLSKYLRDCEFLPLPEGVKGESFCCDLDDGQMTPDSILESPALFGTSSGSGSGANGGVGCRTMACTATTEFVKKKRSSISGPRTAFRARCSPATELAVHMNRRKGIPQRSPLS
ncbi:hypothetical protein ACLOJK_033403 [Asimina triloba]